MANFVQALVAVLAGNILYFLLMPYLPLAARHVPPHPDLGMVLDFWICLVIFGVIKTVVKRRNRTDQI